MYHSTRQDPSQGTLTHEIERILMSARDDSTQPAYVRRLAEKALDGPFEVAAIDRKEPSICPPDQMIDEDSL